MKEYPVVTNTRATGALHAKKGHKGRERCLVWLWYAEEVKSDDARVDRASGRLTGPVLLLNSHSVLSSKSRLRQHGALFALSHQPGRVWRGWMGALWVLAAGPQRFMKDTTLCGSNRRVHCLARDIVGRTCFDHGHKTLTKDICLLESLVRSSERDLRHRRQSRATWRLFAVWCHWCIYPVSIMYIFEAPHNDWYV